MKAAVLREIDGFANFDSLLKGGFGLKYTLSCSLAR